MLYKCANSDCLNLFRSMRQGKMFHVEHFADVGGAAHRRRRVLPRSEHFWLCDDCASVFTLAFTKKRGLVAVPLRANKLPQVESQFGAPPANGGAA